MPSNEDGSVEQPINREPDAAKLTESFLTPSASQLSSGAGNVSHSQPLAYDRNHGPIRHLDAKTHSLAIKSDPSISSDNNLLLNQIDVTYTIDDLSSKFSQTTVTAALQCAGNRRHEMRARFHEVQGIDWGDGAVMNAKWGGVLLRDVLLHAGLKTDDSANYEDLHVHFSSAQPTQDDTFYGSSIPLSTAMDPDRACLLALTMNGHTLTPNHGFPLRAIIPGIIGARSVKWLDEITLAEHESENFYQKRDYKVFSGESAEKIQAAESAEDKGLIMERMQAMGDNPINSVVAVPGNDGDSVERDPEGRVYVRGYAIPQGKDGPVTKVEVSLDKGRVWHEADILDDGDEYTTHASNKGNDRGKFSWVVWECRLPVDGPFVGDMSVWSKATDKGGNTMDVEHPEGEWNLRGVGFNAVEGRRGLKIV